MDDIPTSNALRSGADERLMNSNLSRSSTTDTVKDDEISLSVNQVSKKFCRHLRKSLLYGLQDIGKEVLGIQSQSDELRSGEFWALKDISFQLMRGEALGLIGRNGAGKTTLLRIISGLIRPDQGKVLVRGRVAPLIALGAGFNPILTGKENIYANMAILGVPKEEIDAKFDKVVDFAEIGEAIHSPVQSYSSGMAARLGFACAIYTEPEILLIDEVLSVGDIRFQAKCHRKLSELRAKKTTFILVSHNSQIVSGVCERVIYLDQGNLIAEGEANSIIVKYERDLFLKEKCDDKKTFNSRRLSVEEDSGPERLAITNISMGDTSIPAQSMHSGKPLKICVDCNAKADIENIILRVNFYEKNGLGNSVLFISNQNDNVKLGVSKGQNRIILGLPQVCFKPGKYTMKLIVREGSLNTLDFVESYDFSVDSDMNLSGCNFYQPHFWEVQSA